MTPDRGMPQQSALHPGEAVFRQIVPAGDYWIDTVKKDQVLRIVDVEGNQSADTLFFNAADVSDRYSAVDTIRAQGNVYLGCGSRLLSTAGHVLAEIVADTVGRHDTLGGACAGDPTRSGMRSISAACIHAATASSSP